MQCKDCENIFDDEFKFYDLPWAWKYIPNKKGIYAIRIIGAPEKSTLLETVTQLEKKANEILGENNKEFKDINRRLDRLKRITQDCNIIYIGTNRKDSQNSKQTLKGRYKNLLRSHTITIPLYILLLSDFKLQFGYKETPNCYDEEAKYRSIFATKHGHEPALNYWKK